MHIVELCVFAPLWQIRNKDQFEMNLFRIEKILKCCSSLLLVGTSVLVSENCDRPLLELKEEGTPLLESV